MMSNSCYRMQSTIHSSYYDTAATDLYSLSLHDALPISSSACSGTWLCTKIVARAESMPSARYCAAVTSVRCRSCLGSCWTVRSEEHTSELQTPCKHVCRLLLEKKKVEANEV